MRSVSAEIQPLTTVFCVLAPFNLCFQYLRASSQRYIRRARGKNTFSKTNGAP
jgi:hypothetical protein